MKQFFKFTFASMLGLFLFTIVCGLLSFMMLGAMASMTSTPTKTQPNSVFNLKLSGSLVERSTDDFAALFQSYLGDSESSVGLDDVLKAIEKAKNDNNVKGIYLELGSLSASPAMVLEIRQALEQFKKSDKFIVAYADSYSNNTYHLASVADKIYLNPSGMLGLSGYSMDNVYFKSALEKLGIEMQVFKVGTFKSAVEPFIGTSMSEANRLQTNILAQSLWNQIRSDVAASRGIDASAIDAFADNGTFLEEATEAVKAGLVDSLTYYDGIKTVLEGYCGKDYKSIKLAKMKNISVDEKYQADKIAVVYAVGGIDNNERDGINSQKLSKQLLELAENKDIKAVVLRINSPGGSAYGSEQIWHAAEVLKAKKPLIVSMGTYAASGGYYIACNADTIVAQPNTLTGSIGIFGLVPNINGLTKKLGLSFDGVKTNKYSDFGNMTRPFTADEKLLLQRNVERGYELFVKRCAEGRGMSTDSLKLIAEGRVWTGADALKIGLVDKLGNLDDAIAIAARKAGIENYAVRSYPAIKDFSQQLQELFSDDFETRIMRSQLGENYHYYEQLQMVRGMQGVQAIMPYAYDIR